MTVYVEMFMVCAFGIATTINVGSCGDCWGHKYCTAWKTSFCTA